VELLDEGSHERAWDRGPAVGDILERTRQEAQVEILDEVADRSRMAGTPRPVPVSPPAEPLALALGRLPVSRVERFVAITILTLAMSTVAHALR
jgi:hypothetical protein